MSSKVYVAALADATASRLLPPARRARLQAELRAALPDLNRRYRRALAARFAVTLGDELQGLLTRPAPVWDVAHFIRARFPEIAWVVACGRGPVSTPLAARFAVTLGDELQGLLTRPAPVWDVAHFIRARFPEIAWVVACGRGPISTPLAATAPEVDGPCFHEARAALDRAKPERLVFAFGGFPPALGPLARSYSAPPRRWTPPPRRVPPPLRPGSPARAAAPFHGDPSAISHLSRPMV